MPPGINQVDFRGAKLLRVGRSRFDVGADVSNMFNSAVVLNSNNTFGPAWRTPTLIMPARFAKIFGQVDF